MTARDLYVRAVVEPEDEDDGDELIITFRIESELVEEIIEATPEGREEILVEMVYEHVWDEYGFDADATSILLTTERTT